MADNIIETDTSSQIDAKRENLLKEAQEQVAKAMENAMENISPLPQNSSPSEFLKKNLSVEHQPIEIEVDYVEPMQDPYNKAIKYLENHNVMQLFQQLTARVVYNKPEKPLEFMMNEVIRMKKEKEEEQKQNKS